MSVVPPQATPASIAHHVDALPPGTRLDEFEVVALLGVGGFGMVYQAFDHSLLRFVAIKEYMPTALAGRVDGQSLRVRSVSDEPSFQAGLASFVEEARLLAQFDHPSLVKVFRFWQANQTAYMVMPLYSGMTLKQARAHMRTPPPEDWLRKVLWSVTSALRVLHDAQTLHRDISPDNIFLQDQGPPVLLDLGAARRAISDHGQKHTAVLKVNYAPLEQYMDADAHLQPGPWSDLYSLGAVVHGCLCNDTPLPATLRAIRDRMVSFSRVARTVRKQFGVEYSRSFVDAVAQCLALQPEKRPQSIDAFLQTMGMTSAPAGLESFDFRAQLGDIWVEPSSRDAQGVAEPVIDITAPSQPQDLPLQHSTPQPSRPHSVQRQMQAMTAPLPVARAAAAGPGDHAQPHDFQETVVDADGAATLAFADTCAQEACPPQHQRPARRRAAGVSAPVDTDTAASLVQSGGVTAASEDAPSRRREGGQSGGQSRMAWAMAASLAALAVTAGLWWGQREQAPRYPTPDSEIITELAKPELPPASSASESLAVMPPEETTALPPAPAALATGLASAPLPAPKVRPQRRAVEPAPTQPLPPVAVQPASGALPSPPARPSPALPARAPGPDEVCASASFLARPMCIHEQCQKPGMASHPVCVENRKRREAEERWRQMYSN